MAAAGLVGAVPVLGLSLSRTHLDLPQCSWYRLHTGLGVTHADVPPSLWGQEALESPLFVELRVHWGSLLASTAMVGWFQEGWQGQPGLAPEPSPKRDPEWGQKSVVSVLQCQRAVTGRYSTPCMSMQGAALVTFCQGGDCVWFVTSLQGQAGSLSQ